MQKRAWEILTSPSHKETGVTVFLWGLLLKSSGEKQLGSFEEVKFLGCNRSLS